MQTSLLAFTRHFFSLRTGQPFIENWHHGKIAEYLEAIHAGELRNLIINIPPGSSKTELVSINFPAWALAQNDMCRFLHLSYADKLVELNSQTCRDLISCVEYQDMWRRTVATDSSSKKLWRITKNGQKRGGYYASATGGQVTGFRAGHMEDGFQGCIILDDPQKPEDMEHDVKREASNRQLVNTVRSRRARPDTPLVLIMQRLHEDDATGFLLDGGLGEDFELLKIPAIEDGKSYWEFKEPLKQLEAFKAAQPFTFSGQYQQEPTPEEGTYFKKDWIRYYEELPSNCRLYGASDYAVSEKDGDYTVHGVAAIDTDGNIYIKDWWRGRTESLTWIEMLLDMAGRHKPIAWGEEKGQIIKSLDPLIKRRMQERSVYFARDQFASTADKQARCQSVRGRMQQGKVYFPRGVPWVQEIIAEMLVFPNGKHDDQVDVLGLFGRMLDKMHGESVKKTPLRKPKRGGWMAR